MLEKTVCKFHTSCNSILFLYLNTMSKNSPKGVYQLASWQASAMLAIVIAFLMLWSTKLPQYGDGAIGTAWVLGLAIMGYLVQLVIVTPLLVSRCIRSGLGISFKLFWPLLIGPGLLICFVLIPEFYK
jgi:hypothetical protein